MQNGFALLLWTVRLIPCCQLRTLQNKSLKITHTDIILKACTVEWKCNVCIRMGIKCHSWQGLFVSAQISDSLYPIRKHSDSSDVMLYLATPPSRKTLCQKCHLFPECASFLYMYLCVNRSFSIYYWDSAWYWSLGEDKLYIENTLFERMSCASLCAPLLKMCSCLLRLCWTRFILKCLKRDL